MADLYTNSDLLAQAINALEGKTAGGGGIGGSGVAGSIAKFDGPNSITAGPAFNATHNNQFLRKDGQWVTVSTSVPTAISLNTISSVSETTGITISSDKIIVGDGCGSTTTIKAIVAAIRKLGGNV
jgi:hypothetical protein